MWSSETWVRRISQCIEGKARDAMNSISNPDFDYDTLKAAILEVFQLTPENYRQKFRNMNRQENESVKQYITKLGHTFDNWVKYSGIDVTDAKSISQLMIREQVLEKVPYDMRKHLLQKKIIDTAELAKEAEEYASIIPNYWKTHKPPVNANSNPHVRKGNQNFQNGNQPKSQNGNPRFQTNQANQTKPQNGNQKFPNGQSKPQHAQGGNRQNSRPHPYSRDQRTQWRNDPNSQNSLNRPLFQNQSTRFPQNRNQNQGNAATITRHHRLEHIML